MDVLPTAQPFPGHRQEVTSLHFAHGQLSEVAEGEWRWRNHCWPVLSSRIPNVVCITVRELICGDLSCSHTFTYHLYTADTQICISSPHCFLEGQKQHLVFQLASQFIKWAKLGGQQVPGIHPSLLS